MLQGMNQYGYYPNQGMYQGQVNPPLNNTIQQQQPEKKQSNNTGPSKPQTQNKPQDKPKQQAPQKKE